MISRYPVTPLPASLAGDQVNCGVFTRSASTGLTRLNGSGGLVSTVQVTLTGVVSSSGVLVAAVNVWAPSSSSGVEYSPSGQSTVTLSSLHSKVGESSVEDTLKSAVLSVVMAAGEPEVIAVSVSRRRT